MTTNEQDIIDFWETFMEAKDELEVLDTAESPVYDRILDSLGKINEELYFEYCPNPGASELIITADGNAELFDLVDDIVARAPAVNGWSFFALKPKHGLPESTDWDDLQIDSEEVYYQLLRREGSSELGLQLFVVDLPEEDFEAAHNALLRMIDAYLGERRFAESISQTWIQSISKDETSDHFPLNQLEDQLDSLLPAS
ncbi:hypothetical protein [Cerasicoccus frondis]|uniref:hypothetical protein n=1 Tax=Cerasicoccus frondis TaxID=490090 RepID=UPI002852C9EF|nr:hypothetical protein [Cerasicoccus frondis]